MCRIHKSITLLAIPKTAFIPRITERRNVCLHNPEYALDMNKRSARLVIDDAFCSIGELFAYPYERSGCGRRGGVPLSSSGLA